MKTISLEEFNRMPHNEQIAVHDEMKKAMGINGILDAWNISRSKYYYMMKKLNPETTGSEKQAEPKQKKQQKRMPARGKQNIVKETRAALKRDAADKVAFSVSIEGSQQAVSKILESVADMNMAPDANFVVNVSIQQI